MAVVPIRKPKETSNIIELKVINGKASVKQEIRYNKDGTVDKRRSNKVAGVSSEVYPFTTEEEIKAMIDMFDKHIEEAVTPTQKQIACRNKMMFVIGINLGIRASDLCGLRYSFFYNNNGTFKDFYTLQPKKTRKTGKFVKLYFNDAVKKAITNYTEEYPIQDMEEYLFKSRKGSGSITEHTLWDVISKTAIEAGIEKNIGSHSLRKTFGRFVFQNAMDKNKALVILQTIFNHSSPAVTSRYIGLTDDEVSDVFNELNLGLDYI